MYGNCRLNMIIISHRGNIEGPNSDCENHPAYIVKALEQGFDVEIDLWKTDRLYLGHSKPTYEVESKKLGCEVVDIIKMRNVSNILNPTYCYIFKVKKDLNPNNKNTQFTYPGTDFILEDKADYLYSKKYGKVFLNL